MSGAVEPRVRASKRATLASGDVRRTVYLSPDLWRAVLQLAQRRDVTAAAIVRQAVAEHVERSAGEAPAAHPKPLSGVARIAAKRRQPVRCEVCYSTTDLTVDHIVPVSRGGWNCYSNLRVLCRLCNSSKGGRLDSEWLPARQAALRRAATEGGDE